VLLVVWFSLSDVTASRRKGLAAAKVAAQMISYFMQTKVLVNS
jgi:hypothetical protein